MSKNENIHEPGIIITPKGNFTCPACNAPKAACRCAKGGAGGSEEPSQDLELKEGVTSSTSSSKPEYQSTTTQNRFAQFQQGLKDQRATPLTPQNKSADSENDRAKAKSPFSIPNPFALPECTRS